MKFRVGQRVRAINSMNMNAVKFIGIVGTILSYAGEHPPCGPCWVVRWDELGIVHAGIEPQSCLAPLPKARAKATSRAKRKDRAADQFIKRIKKIADEPVIEAPAKVTE